MFVHSSVKCQCLGHYLGIGVCINIIETWFLLLVIFLKVSSILIKCVISLCIDDHFNFRISYLKRGIFQSSFISMLLKLMLISIVIIHRYFYKEMNDNLNKIFFPSLSLGSWGVNVLIPVHS